jgi:type IV pilus assembly protein PilX
MHTLLSTLRYTLRTCRQSRSANQHYCHPRRGAFNTGTVAKERGAALITALMILLIMTLLGITAVTTSTLQEKMAGNMRDGYMAQEAGDSILRDGESWIYNRITKPLKSCSPTSSERVWDSACLPTDLTSQSATNDIWWVTNGFTSNVSNGHVSQEPRYVETFSQRVQTDLGSAKPKYRYFYRTIGWSVGATNFAKGLFESTFSRRSDEFQP